MINNATSNVDHAKIGGEEPSIQRFKPCGYNLEVTIDGMVRRIGKEKIRKPQIIGEKGLKRVNCYFEGKTYYPSVSKLVAKAWRKDYYEGCHVYWKDGNPMNSHADNLVICNDKEFRAYKSLQVLRKKQVSMGYKDSDFLPCNYYDLECTKDGVVRRYGVIYQKKKKYKPSGDMNGYLVIITIDGKRRYFNVADLICRAWKKNWFEGSYHVYRDGDINNCTLENLKVVERAEYNKYCSRNSKTKLPTITEEVEKLERIIKEANMSLNYLRTGDIEPYNRYVKDYLYGYLVGICRKIEVSRSQSDVLIRSVLCELYLLIDSNRGVFSVTMFCDKRLRDWKYEKKEINDYKRMPVKIENSLKALNLEGLAEKFKMGKLK